MPIPIKGIISSDDYAEAYQAMGYSTATPKDVEDALNKLNGQPTKIEINSPGGDVDAGSEIYTALKNYEQAYKTSVEVDIVGLAASAASFIAMAGTKVAISPTAQLFIHRASTVALGNADDVESVLDGLNSTDRSLVDIYVQKTGMKPEDIYNMMAKETTINAKDALDMGFVDEIMFADAAPKVTNLALPVINSDVVKRVKALLIKAKNNNDTSSQPAKDEHSLLDSKLAILFERNE